MKTYRRFTAEFRAKVALEAIAGADDSELDASINLDTSKNLPIPTGHIELPRIFRPGFDSIALLICAEASDARTGPQRGEAAEHRLNRVGRHGLSIEEERGLARQERLRLRHPSEEAEGSADE